MPGQPSGASISHDRMTDSEQTLAPYAYRSGSSRGRRRPEPTHAFRNPFQRDRDRVIHSRAFRRLEYKTQVFLNSAGDHYRTRLTHTIEVAAVARTVARRLCVNEDLTEAVALAHDLGHAPFGHVGERILNEALKQHGGFDHNRQCLRVVDLLEEKYPGIDGLNLTWEVRSGLVKRRGRRSKLDGEILPPSPCVEAQIADVADDLAYYAHDLDDGIAAGLIHPRQLKDLTLWGLAAEDARRAGGDPGAPYFTAFVIRCLIDRLVGNVIEWSLRQLAETAPSSPSEVEALERPLVGFSPEFAEGAVELRTFLFQHLYWHPLILEVNTRVGRVVADLYEWFLAHPEKLGRRARAVIRRDGIHRAVADYIAGMTDRYALKMHADIFGTKTPSL